MSRAGFARDRRHLLGVARGDHVRARVARRIRPRPSAVRAYGGVPGARRRRGPMGRRFGCSRRRCAAPRWARSRSTLSAPSAVAGARARLALGLREQPAGAALSLLQRRAASLRLGPPHSRRPATVAHRRRIPERVHAPTSGERAGIASPTDLGAHTCRRRRGHGHGIGRRLVAMGRVGGLSRRRTGRMRGTRRRCARRRVCRAARGGMAARLWSSLAARRGHDRGHLGDPLAGGRHPLSGTDGRRAARHRERRFDLVHVARRRGASRVPRRARRWPAPMRVGRVAVGPAGRAGIITAVATVVVRPSCVARGLLAQGPQRVGAHRRRAPLGCVRARRSLFRSARRARPGARVDFRRQRRRPPPSRAEAGGRSPHLGRPLLWLCASCFSFLFFLLLSQKPAEGHARRIKKPIVIFFSGGNGRLFAVSKGGCRRRKKK